MTQTSGETVKAAISQHLLARWVGVVQRYPKFTLTVAALLAILSLAYTGLRLGFKTDRTDLVNPSRAYFQDWERYEQEFGGDLDIVVAIEGADQTKMISALETIAREIDAFPEHFTRLSYRINTDRLRAKGLYQLPLSDLRVIESRIEALRPLLIGTWQWMTLDNVLRATRFRLSAVAVDKPLDDGSQQALESCARLVESLSYYLENGTVYQSPWSSVFAEQRSGRAEQIPEYFFSNAGHTAILRVIPVSDPNDFAGTKKPVAIIRQIIARLEPLFPELEFGLTGLPVLENDEMLAAKDASAKSMLLTLLGVGLLFVTAFRAFRHPIYGMITLGVGASWALGWITLTVGHLNVLSVSFIVTLIGLGIDYSILWLSRYESGRTHGLTGEQANLETAQSVGPGITVGALTTGMSFFAMLFSGFLGLCEMGWIAGSGVILCLLATFTMLPALLTVGCCQSLSAERGRWDDRPALPSIARRPLAIAIGSGAVVVILGFFAPRLKYDYNLLNLQHEELKSVQWEKRLIEETGTSAWYALSIASSVEEARELKREFESLPSVGRVVDIASMIPVNQPEKLPIVRQVHQALERLPHESPLENLPPPGADSLGEQLAAIARMSLPAAAGHRRLAQRMSAGAESARQALAKLSPEEQTKRLGAYQKLWLTDLWKQLRKLQEASDPEPVTVADLPPSLVSRYYSPSGKWLLQIFANTSVWDIEPLRAFRDDVMTVDEHATGKPISTVHALLEMNDGCRHSAYFAIGVIALLVWFDFRNLVDTVLAMVPLLLGVTSMFGAMGLFGIALNPANLIALPLILGIGVDFGVHVMHDYRNSKGPYLMTWRLARALGLTTATTIVGFASLMTAQHWGMASIGLVLSIGISACYLTSLTFLPAVLNLCSRARPSVSAIVGMDESFEETTALAHKAA